MASVKQLFKLKEKTPINVAIIIDRKGNVIAVKANKKGGESVVVGDRQYVFVGEPLFIDGLYRYYLFYEDNGTPLQRGAEGIKPPPKDLYATVKRIALSRYEQTLRYHVMLAILVSAIAAGLAGLCYLELTNIKPMLQQILAKVGKLVGGVVSK